jgi:hypothetical protein
VLALARVAALVGLAAVLLTGAAARSSGAPVTRPPAHQSGTPTASRSPVAHHKKAARQASALPPAAAAAGALVGDLQAGVADGQVAQSAGQDLFNHLQQLLFGRRGQNLQQVQQQYQQLVQAYDRQQSQGQITGPAAASMRRDIRALGVGLGAT